MTRWTITFLVLLCGTVLSACTGDPTISDKDVEVIEYPQFINVRANEKKKTVVVDVRSEKEFELEHIPGAINIKLPDIGPGDKRLAEAKTIVVYDSGTRRYSLSNAGAKKFLWHGYKNVLDFRGGLFVWKKQGGKTEGTAVTAEN